MKKSLIYTRTGDKGRTSLVGGFRVSKTHARLEAYGTVDELNSHIGVVIAHLPEGSDKDLLQYVQHKLFSIGSYLATDTSRMELDASSHVSDEGIKRMEDALDEIDASLPPLTAFVLPGGNLISAECHRARTVCRRAERRILALEEQGICELDVKVKRFVNRLSDYLFILARKMNYSNNNEEIYWDKSCE